MRRQDLTRINYDKNDDADLAPLALTLPCTPGSRSIALVKPKAPVRHRDGWSPTEQIRVIVRDRG